MNFKHGSCRRGNYTPTYRSWMSMIQRCDSPSASRYKNYGERGIGIAPEWREFTPFLEDMGERPHGTTLDRVRVDENYGPDNCRWATPTQQQRNTTVTRWLEYGGEKLSLAEWADRLGIKAKTLRARLDDHGWPLERALTAPVRVQRSRTL